MKRSHLNLGLLAVAIGLGAAVWFSQKKEEKRPPLTALAPAAVTRVLLEHPGAPALRLEKKDGSWQLVEPIQAPAEPFEVNALVGLADTEVQQMLEGSLDLKELGLDPPSYKLTLNDQLIEFGGSEPLKYRRYLRHAGKVVLINDPPSAALDQDYSDLVTKSVLPEGADIVRIAVPGLTVEKKPDGGWTSPEQPQAKPEQLQKFVDAWKNAKALWNSADEGEPPQETATVTLADGRSFSFGIAARDPQLVLVRADWRLRQTLPRSDVETLLALPAEPPPGDAPADTAPAAPAQ